MKKLRIAGWTLLGLLIVLAAARLLAWPLRPTYRFLDGASYQGTKVSNRQLWRLYRMPGRVDKVRNKAELELPDGPGNSSSFAAEGPDGLSSWGTTGGPTRDSIEYGVLVSAEQKGTVLVEVLEPPTLWDRFLRFVRLR